MNSRTIIINKFEGENFAKLSGDNNTIHINKAVGYNSLFGYNIAHGVLVIIKFLKRIKINENYSFIKIQFYKGFKYNSKIKIQVVKKNKNLITYKLNQENNTNAIIEVGFLFKHYLNLSLKNKTFTKKYFIPKKFKKINFETKVSNDLKISLCHLSKYVGTVYPGKNSLIKEINVFKNNNKYNNKKNNKLIINSSKLSKVFPLIDNILSYKNYDIQFKTLIRPSLKINLNKPNKNLSKEINAIKDNVLIVGGSSGIGNDLLKLFLINKKIKIISTYYKNKININKKNLIKKKINIKKDLNYLYQIIKKFSPIIIYYFPTPKIYFKSIANKNIIKEYKEYFIKIPIKIIKFSNSYNSKFFYPSTTYNNILSPYSKLKLEAEKKINKLKQNNGKINILKIPGINTKQNLSLMHQNLPNFRDLISKDKAVRNAVFFKKE